MNLRLKNISNLFLVFIFSIGFIACHPKTREMENQSPPATPDNETTKPADDHPNLSEIEKPNKNNKKRTPFELFSKASTNLDAIKYTLKLDLMPNQIGIQVHEVLRVRMLSSSDVINLDAGSTLQIESVAINSRVLSSIEHSDDVLKLPLNEDEQKSLFLNIELKYKVLGNDSLLFFSGSDNEIFQLATETEPIGSRDWIVSIDRPEDKALLETFIKVPQSWKALSNGELISEKNINDKQIEFHWNMDAPQSTYLFSVVAGKLQIESIPGYKVPVHIWFPEEIRSRVVNSFMRVPSMLEFLSNKLIPYPYSKFDVAIVSQYGGAMEHTTAVTYAQSIVDAYSGEGRMDEFTTFHEMTHHWFGDTVTCQNWDELWLNEGLTSYLEMLYAREFFAENNQKTFEWYLSNFRRDYFTKEGKDYSVGPIYNPLNSPGEKFTPASYQKPALVLNMLAEEIGEETLFQGLRIYLKNNFMGSGITADLQKSIEMAYGKSLEDYFQQWIYRSGYPEIKVQTHIEDKKVHINLKQINADRVGVFKLNIPIQIRMKSDSNSESRSDSNSDTHSHSSSESNLGTSNTIEKRISFNEEEQSIDFEFSQNVESVIVDPKMALLVKWQWDLDPEMMKSLLLKNQASSIHEIDFIQALKDKLTKEDLLSIYNNTRFNETVRAEAFQTLFVNFGSENLQTMLKEGLNHPHWLIRKAAYKSVVISKVDSEFVFEELSKRVLNEPYTGIYRYLLEAFALTHHPQIYNVLNELLAKNTNREITVQVARALVPLKDPQSIPLLRPLIQDSYSFVQSAAIAALKDIKDDSMSKIFGEALLRQTERKDAYRSEYWVTLELVKALGKIHDNTAKEFLEKANAKPVSLQVKSAIESALKDW